MIIASVLISTLLLKALTSSRLVVLDIWQEFSFSSAPFEPQTFFDDHFKTAPSTRVAKCNCSANEVSPFD